MTKEQITSRCEHCGGTKKEHGTRKPYACPTRLKETAWKPWTIEAYEAAIDKTQEAAVASGKAAMAAQEEPPVIPAVPQEEPREIDLTPNFAGIFQQFARDAASAGESLAAGICVAQFGSGNYTESPENYGRRGAVLRAVQAFLAPASIALGCATSARDIERIREVMAKALEHVNQRAMEFESYAEEGD
jgi:hypothetical protein